MRGPMASVGILKGVRTLTSSQHSLNDASPYHNRDTMGDHSVWQGNCHVDFHVSPRQRLDLPSLTSDHGEEILTATTLHKL